MEFVTVHTLGKQGEPRNVTLAKWSTGEIVLLGLLEHGTEILVDQTLVDELQKLVDLKKKN